MNNCWTNILYLKTVDIDSKLFAIWLKGKSKLISYANYLEYLLKLHSFIDSEGKLCGVGFKRTFFFLVLSTNYSERRLKLNPFVDLACRLYLYWKLNPAAALFMRIGVNWSLLSLQGVTNRNECNTVDCYGTCGDGAKDEEQDYCCCTYLRKSLKAREEKSKRWPSKELQAYLCNQKGAERRKKETMMIRCGK
jgi:hypothetical protein